MIKKQIDGAIYFQFSNLSEFPDISHGVFTRQGGVSKGRFNSLNIGSNVGDDLTHVDENKKIVHKIIGGEYLVTLDQVHSNLVFDHKTQIPAKQTEADAVVTSIKGASLLIQTADCQAILLYDPVKKVIANIHSGWKGSIINIIGNTVNHMALVHNTKPSDIIAGVGPSLGLCCAEFTNYKLEIPERFWKYKNGNNHFDFWEISRDQLTESGVMKDNIEISNFCTKCNQDLFFSYRRDKVTGRLANIISLI